MATPRVEIDAEGVRRLAQIGCTIREIAHFYGCGHATLERRLQFEPEFREAFDNGQANLKVGLRKKQVEQALSGNTTMLIWLGKQMLGQSDKAELSGKDGQPLQVSATFTLIQKVITEKLAHLPQEDRTRLGELLLAIDGPDD